VQWEGMDDEEAPYLMKEFHEHLGKCDLEKENSCPNVCVCVCSVSVFPLFRFLSLENRRGSALSKHYFHYHYVYVHSKNE
jgi:hypothetical protein